MAMKVLYRTLSSSSQVEHGNHSDIAHKKTHSQYVFGIENPHPFPSFVVCQHITPTIYCISKFICTKCNHSFTRVDNYILLRSYAHSVSSFGNF